MKILVVSDTHRMDNFCLEVIKREAPLDMLIHCGDLEGSQYIISDAAKCETHMVAGNNDYNSYLPSEKEFLIGGYKAFLTHGNRYHVSFDTEYIVQEAISRGANIVFYGHTHRPVARVEDGVYLFNPGSISYPRQEGKRPSYIVIEIDEKDNLTYEVHFL